MEQCSDPFLEFLYVTVHLTQNLHEHRVPSFVLFYACYYQYASYAAAGTYMTINACGMSARLAFTRRLSFHHIWNMRVVIKTSMSCILHRKDDWLLSKKVGYTIQPFMFLSAPHFKAPGIMMKLTASIRAPTYHCYADIWLLLFRDSLYPELRDWLVC